MTAATRPPSEPGPTRPARSRTGAVGGMTAGLMPRVQRRLAAHGVVAGDPAGLRSAVAETLAEDGILLPEANLAALVRSVADELTGLGPLAPLLADPAVTDVLVNGPAEVWVERGGTSNGRRCGSRPPMPSPRWSSAWSLPSVSGSTSPVPGSTPGSPAASGSTRCSLRWPRTARWSPSAPSPGAGSTCTT